MRMGDDWLLLSECTLAFTVAAAVASAFRSHVEDESRLSCGVLS